MRVKYVANDGAEFADEAMCRAYERLIEASKTSAFRKLVQGLFDDCKSWESGSDPMDPSYAVFNLENERMMEKFMANLVRTLPALQHELQEALNKV